MLRLAILVGVWLVLGTIAKANAASTLKLTCTGELTDTRKDGVTLGECDLNFITVKQTNEIEDVAELPAPLTHRLQINVEYERSSRPIQLPPEITESYTRCLRCGRWISEPSNHDHGFTCDPRISFSAASMRSQFSASSV
jgi:hypothetical protein